MTMPSSASTATASSSGLTSAAALPPAAAAGQPPTGAATSTTASTRDAVANAQRNPVTFSTAAGGSSATAAAPAKQPPIVITKPPTIPSTASRKTRNENAILVSERQRGNPLLKHIRAVPCEFMADILPDYIVGETSCCLYISMKYHLLHPKYLQVRFDTISKNFFNARILLCHVDQDDVLVALEEITRLAYLNHWTLLLCWSAEECGRYIETCKVYEKKPADLIQTKVVESDVKAKYHELLTMVKSVNKTDVSTLAHQFTSFHRLCTAPMEEIALLPGFGQTKVKRLYNALHMPFVSQEPAFMERNASGTLKRHGSTASPSPNPSPSPSPSPTLSASKPPASTSVKHPSPAPAPKPSPIIPVQSLTSISGNKAAPTSRPPSVSGPQKTLTDSSTSASSQLPKKQKTTVSSVNNNDDFDFVDLT